MECCERKIAIPEQFATHEPVMVPQSFIDTNHHMNNSRYVQVALQYLPEERVVKEVRVDYRKAAMQGDLLIPRVTLADDCATVVLGAEDGKPYAIVEFL